MIEPKIYLILKYKKIKNFILPIHWVINKKMAFLHQFTSNDPIFFAKKTDLLWQYMATIIADKESNIDM